MISKNKLDYIDTLRAIATVGVVLIHISSPLINMNWNINPVFWWIGNFDSAIVRFAVPLFLMISGVTLIRPKYDFPVFYTKRASRVFIPLLFWLVVYWIFRAMVLKSDQQPTSLEEWLDWAVQLFLNEGVSKHLWYVYMIFFIYLSIPFWGKFVYNLSNKYMLILLILWFVLIQWVKDIPFNPYNWSDHFDLRLINYFTYSFYFVLGFFLSRLNILQIKKTAFPVLGIIYIFTILYAAFSAKYLSDQLGKMNLNTHGYLHWNTIIQSITVFLMIKMSDIQYKLLINLRNIISNYSYGIYLVHILVLGILWNNKIYWAIFHPLLAVPFLVVLTIMISYGLIFLLRKIPGGRYISG